MTDLPPGTEANQDAQLCFSGLSFAVQQLSGTRRSRRRLAPGMGGLLVFEGPDGVGKSTISKALVDYLRCRGFDCIWSAFPGREDGTLGNFVYEVHHGLGRAASISAIHPAALQQLHVAAHTHEILTKILPAIKSGKLVILDRYWWSTWVYGRAAGLSVRTLKRILAPEHEHWAGMRPYAALLLSRAPIDQESELHSVLVAEYAALAKGERRKHRIYSVHNERTVEETIEQIIQVTGFEFRATVKPQTKRDAVSPLQLDLLSSNQPTFPEVQPVTKQPKVSKSTRLGPAKPTVVFDTYWYFAVERQRIFFRRLAGAPQPWSEDPIIQEHKFTNAYRASDRVSQYLISRVIYEGDQDPAETFFRIILFKIFNRIDTWELLKENLGEIYYRDYSFKRYDDILSRAMARGQRIYSPAYIMPSGGPSCGDDRKHRMHLHLIERMMKDSLPAQISDSKTMARVFELLRAYPSIGDFLAYQYVTDINYSALTNFEETTFVMPGPGARDGIRKCFSDLGGLTEAQLIEQVTYAQQDEFARLGLSFQSLWGRQLQFIDCQNLFCEVDKYARVKHPEYSGHTGRTRIKQKFYCNPEPIRLMYPPKWGINEMIPGGVRHVSNFQR